ncbi:methionine--tRNA ligase, cytoplasmic-like [Phragmites australis]|uniref:methionine--tRNA ligase, cytoplasmic-like n=1 Tax=Phragmites australis TaxID=29695 RepID=UPI002D774D3F|nr:methionine--tRNA ligase, cytoplasmic-like [Phragmites australis]
MAAPDAPSDRGPSLLDPNCRKAKCYGPSRLSSGSQGRADATSNPQYGPNTRRLGFLHFFHPSPCSRLGVLMAAAADLAQSKRAMAYALCKHLNIDPNTISNTSIEKSDIASLFSHIVNTSQDEVTKWVTFSSDFAGNNGKQHTLLANLNQDLSQKSVLLCDGFKPSVADIVVFATVQDFMSLISNNESQKYPHVLRWMDHIQNVVDFGTSLQKINVTKSVFDPPSHPKKADKGDADPSSKKAVSGQKISDKSNRSADSKKAAGESKALEDKENPNAAKNDKHSGEKNKVAAKSTGKTTEKAAEKAPEKTAEKDSECNISILNIQVGLIRKAWKHPSADSLLVEEIDLGDGNVRQVVSGLAKYYSPDELVNRHVVLITNVKPGKLRDVMSAGLVLCASTQDLTVVEPLIPPEGAKVGEHISFAGFVGKPEDVLNPKKKQLDKITPHLRTDENGIATFKGIPFTTSAGPCRSSIPNANIK